MPWSWFQQDLSFALVVNDMISGCFLSTEPGLAFTLLLPCSPDNPTIPHTCQCYLPKTAQIKPDHTSLWLKCHQFTFLQATKLNQRQIPCCSLTVPSLVCLLQHHSSMGCLLLCACLCRSSLPASPFLHCVSLLVSLYPDHILETSFSFYPFPGSSLLEYKCKQGPRLLCLIYGHSSRV